MVATTSDKLVVSVDDRQRTDVVFRHEFGRFSHTGIWPDRHHVACHHIRRIHEFLLGRPENLTSCVSRKTSSSHSQTVALKRAVEF
jgi:hypothetical protein